MNVTDVLSAVLADRYRLERELGQGGMATVYLAHDRRHDRHVAVKVLRPELAAVIGAERFLSEIRTTANLQHPHILPLFDSGEAGGFLFYVMPYIDGESLRDRLTREKQLPIADTVRIATEVGSALDYAHRHGVIHRDIKPENLLLHDGRALVADFGIALAASKAGSRMTETGMSLGTPHYMSPEQAMGEREVTARSDIYALGAVTYEMLTGDPPFTGSTAQAIVAKVLTEKPAAPSRFRDTVPAAIEDAVLVALAKLPADRWQSAAAFVSALEGKGEVARSGATAARRGPARRWSAGSPLPWALALGIASVAAIWGWLPSPSPAAPPVVRFALQPAPGTSFAYPVGGSAMQVGLSPDGRLAVYAAGASGSRWMLHVRSLDQLISRALPGTEGALNPEFSPDGRWIAFRSADGKLKKIAVDGTALTTLCTIDNSAAVGSGLTWISEQEIVFAKGTYTEGRALWRVSSNGGQPTEFSQMDSASGERIQLAPRAADQGRLVFYSSTIASNADMTLGVIETATGKPTVFQGVRGARVLGLLEDYLIYVRGDGALMAAPFDVKRRRLGPPIQISDSVAVPASFVWATPAAVSASGSLLYQHGGVASQLVSVTPRGEVRILVDSMQAYSHPRLSPDGRRLAVEVRGAAGSDVWIFDLGAGTSERLTREWYNDRPEWSRDGSRVMYTSSRAPADALWWQPADGSAPATLVHQDSSPIREGVFTPDGRAFVYRVDTRENNRDIYLRELGEGKRPVPLLISINDDKQPRVSWDSKWLAYVSNETGREEVYVRALSGASGRVPVSAGGGGEPLWSRDGKRLFYRTGSSLIAADIITSPALAVTSRTVLFEGSFETDIFHPNYDVVLNGESFIMVRPVEANRQLVMVVDWLRELRHRTGESR